LNLELKNFNATFNVNHAIKIQEELSERIIDRDLLPHPIRYVCGVDVSYSSGLAFTCAVTLSYPELYLVEVVCSTVKVTLPYLPGFLAFRELKPIIRTMRKRYYPVDVLFIDGHGRAHPRLFGLACHVGLSLNIPTIGVAKRLLCGKILYNTLVDGLYYPVLYKGNIVGAALKVKDERIIGAYVSIGHKVSLRTAVKLTFNCIRFGCSPEPLRLAHIYSKSFRRHFC